MVTTDTNYSEIFDNLNTATWRVKNIVKKILQQPHPFRYVLFIMYKETNCVAGFVPHINNIGQYINLCSQ